MTDMELHEILNSVGEENIGALSKVAQSAKTEINSSSKRNLPSTLVNPSNFMVGQGKAERNVTEINTAVLDDLRRLLREPFVARVEVKWEREWDRDAKEIGRAHV